MKLHGTALLAGFLLMTPLGSAGIITSILATGETLANPSLGTQNVVYDCSNGCEDPQGSNIYAYGSASAFFSGDPLTSYASMDQEIEGPFPLSLETISTTAGFTENGVASGGTGAGTLKYEIMIFGPCFSEGCDQFSSIFPNLTAPGTLTYVLPGQTPTCGNGESWEECIYGTINFTYDVPFDFSFIMSTFQSTYGPEVYASEELSFLNLSVPDNPDATLQFTSTPEAGNRNLTLFGLGVLAMLGVIRRRPSRLLSGPFFPDSLFNRGRKNPINSHRTCRDLVRAQTGSN